MTELDGSDIRNAARRLGEVDDLVNDMAADVVGELGVSALDNVRRARGRHSVTGKGVRMVKLEQTGSGERRVSRIHAGGRVAHLLTGGTRAHTIRARPGRALALAGGPQPFAAAVRHPGTRPVPFVAQGVAETRRDARRITDVAAEELGTDIAKRIGRR